MGVPISPLCSTTVPKSPKFLPHTGGLRTAPLPQHTQAWGGPPWKGGWLYSILCDMSILAPPPSPLSLFTKCRPSLRLACT